VIVALSLFTAFQNFTTFAPTALQTPFVHTMIDQVVAWSTVLAPLRTS
jgi:hypothetical protein